MISTRGFMMRNSRGKWSVGVCSIYGRWFSTASSKYSAYHARRGWAWVDSLHRSPVSHPLGYPLVLLFDWLENTRSNGKLDAAKLGRDKSSDMLLLPDDDTTSTVAASGWKLHDVQQSLVYLGEGANRLNFGKAAQIAENRRNDLDLLLRPVVNAWDRDSRTERDLIQAICALRMESSSSCSDLTTPCPLPNLHFRAMGRREQERGHIYEWGKYDLILADTVTENLVTLLMLGKGEESKWWSRTLQGLQCQDILYGETRDPRLWIVREDLESDDPLPANASHTTPSLLATIVYDENGTHFRMGVFLCWYDYYVQKDHRPSMLRFNSLLWEQYDTVGEGSLSAALATLVAVSETFNQWLEIDEVDQSEYMSLGYDCAKVLWQQDEKSQAVEKVLRCYDTRVSPIHRTPAVYLHSTMFTTENDVMNAVNVASNRPRVISLPCPNRPTYPTPQFPNNVEDLKRPNHADWIWTARNGDGQLNVIAVPYWHGRHIAQRPVDFVPIVQQLRRLHDQNYVHGDIRCSNMVLDGATNGRLIDYDFGGISGQVRYPPRYDGLCGDGSRLGEGGKLIEKRHDWYALWQVIFWLHRFDPPPSQMDTFNDKRRAIILEKQYCQEDRYDLTNDPDVLKRFAERIVALLQRMDTEGWSCRPSTWLESWMRRMDVKWDDDSSDSDKEPSS